MLTAVPFEKGDWRPHEKSMTLKRPVTHVAEIPNGLTVTLDTDELDFAKGYKPNTLSSKEELIALFEKCAAESMEKLRNATDENFRSNWTMRNGDHIYFTLPKLQKTGADNVILPDKIGGTHMATLVTKPDGIEFIDYLSGEEREIINVESVPYDELPEKIKDKTLHDVMNWNKTGVNCIGIKDGEGKFVINPPEDTNITKGMKVIVLGTRMQIEKMRQNLGG